MKFLGLIVIFVYFSCCSAAANRSTVWVLGNYQIYSTSQGYQYCSATASGTATSISLLSTSKLTVTGKYVGIASDDPATYIANNVMLSEINIKFMYNSTHYLTLELNQPGSVIASLANLLNGDYTSATPTQYLAGTPTSFPIVVRNFQIFSPASTLWLEFSSIADTYTTTTNYVISNMLIVDYASSSTIAISQFAGSNAGGSVPNNFYQIAIRTLTSSITGSTVLTAGCTSQTGRKRSLDHIINKRLLTCPSSAGLDSSLTSTIASNICNNAASIYAATATPTKTSTNLADAMARGMNLVNAVNTADNAYFSTADSKFKTAAIFSHLIALSSIIFIYL